MSEEQSILGHENLVAIHNVQDHVELALLEETFSETNLHYVVQEFEDHSFDMMEPFTQGLARLLVLEEDVPKAKELVEKVLEERRLAAEEEQDGEEPEDEEID